MSDQVAVLPPPYRVNTVGLLLTLRCNAECAHCCFECHPKRTEQMSRTQALDYIGQIAQLENVHSITLTGGEPFIAYPLLRSSIEAAGAHGLSSRLVSNGYWASSAKAARQKLAPLVEAGLTTLNISHDAPHAAYIDPARVRQAALSALDLGLEVVISHASLQGPQAGDGERILEGLGLPPETPLSLIQGHIGPGGRSSQSYGLEQMSLIDGYSPEGQELHGVCGYVLREPVITPNGDFAACCGTTVAAPHGFHEAFVVGNLKERPLAEWVEALEYHPLFTLLMLDGPWRLYEALQARDPEALGRTRFVNICDLCAQLVCNERAMAQLGPLLAEQEPALMVKKMMLDLAREEKLAAEA